MKQFLVLILLLFFSACVNTIPSELVELETVLKTDFSDKNISNKLIPISLDDDLTYDSFLFKSSNKSKPINAEELPVQNIRSGVELKVGRELFQHLIFNKLINESDYHKLIAEIKSVTSIDKELEGDMYFSKSLTKIITEKEIGQYQQFAYPIMTDKFLILYRNLYSNSSMDESLGSTRNGIYFIYKKENEGWKLINQITKWIS